MAQETSGDAHGFYRAQIALIAPDGKAYGTAGPNADAGTISGAYIAGYPKNCDMPFPDRTVIDFTGKDTWNGSYMYGITSLGSFSMTLENVDASLIALVSGSTVDQVTNANWTYYAENILAEQVPQVALILTYRFQARGGVNDGADLYLNTIIPRCWIAPKGISGAPAFQQAGEYQFQVTPTAAARHPHGLPFSAMSLNLQDNRTPSLHVVTNNPLYLVTMVGDAAATTFTMPYLPVSSTVTLNDTPNEFVVDGALVAPTSFDTSTGVLTPATTLADGEHAAILYETTFATAA